MKQQRENDMTTILFSKVKKDPKIIQLLGADSKYPDRTKVSFGFTVSFNRRKLSGWIGDGDRDRNLPPLSWETKMQVAEVVADHVEKLVPGYAFSFSAVKDGKQSKFFERKITSSAFVNSGPQPWELLPVEPVF